MTGKTVTVRLGATYKASRVDSSLILIRFGAFGRSDPVNLAECGGKMLPEKKIGSRGPKQLSSVVTDTTSADETG
jgi:hypothetical protein